MQYSWDRAQYGDAKKVSLQQYLVKMLNKIISSIDQNVTKEFSKWLTVNTPLTGKHTSMEFNNSCKIKTINDNCWHERAPFQSVSVRMVDWQWR